MLQTQTVYPRTLSLLRELMDIPYLSGYNLAGGTALALQLGHRISVDIDLFGSEEIPHDLLLSTFSEIGDLTVMSQNKLIVSCTIDDVKVDVVKYKYGLLEPLIKEGNIRLLSLKDIAAMKLAAIIGRGRKRDFTDLYFLLQHFSLPEMVGFFNDKYPDGSEFLIYKSLLYFDEADTEISPNMLVPYDWEQVKGFIRDSVFTSE